MLIPSLKPPIPHVAPSLSRRVNANSQLAAKHGDIEAKLIKKGEC